MDLLLRNSGRPNNGSLVPQDTAGSRHMAAWSVSRNSKSLLSTLWDNLMLNHTWFSMVAIEIP